MTALQKGIQKGKGKTLFQVYQILNEYSIATQIAETQSLLLKQQNKFKWFFLKNRYYKEQLRFSYAVQSTIEDLRSEIDRIA